MDAEDSAPRSRGATGSEGGGTRGDAVGRAGSGTATVAPAPAAGRDPRGADIAPGFSWGLQKYLGREVLKVFFFVLFLIEIGYALLVALVVARRWDLDLLLVVPVLWRTALSMLNDSVPIALLFAAGLGYGRFFADREVTALQSFGLSFRQILQPLVLIGTAAALVGVVVVGFLCPEMNYAKGDVSTLLSAQLRYLGEGVNRHFPFGNYSLWITHYDGRELKGVTLRPQGDAEELLPEGVDAANAPTIPFFLWAQRARILFPEELAAEEAARRARELEDGVEADEFDARVKAAVTPEYEPGSIIFRLFNVSVYISDQFFSGGEPSRYMHLAKLDYINFPYRPAELVPLNRRPKQLLLHEIYRKMETYESRMEQYPDDEVVARKHAELAGEFWFRWARIASFFLYPVLAGLVALLVRSENRYFAFFVACLIVPPTFYGCGSAGQVLVRAGVPAWAAMTTGPAMLAILGVLGLVALERRWR